jgi:hypothetical protein
MNSIKIKKNMFRPSLLLIFLSSIINVTGQENRVFVPREITQAIEKGTRSSDGTPGIDYFQNRTDYHIDAEYIPKSRTLSGKGLITYYNHSNEQLRFIVIRLYQNVFMKGGIRGRSVDPADLHDGVKIHRIAINGKDYKPDSPGYKTQTNIVFPMNLSPLDTAEIEVEWEFTMPRYTTNRFGCYKTGACFIAYWFPQVAVYDDTHGWDLSDYTGVAEFYNNYGDFEVNLTVPHNYIVWATGEFMNPAEVLSRELLERYNQAKLSDEIIPLISEEDLKKKKALLKKGSNTWRFSAKNVNDFAFGVSDNYRWDATSVEINDKNGTKKRVLIESAYDRKAVNFRQVAEIAAWSVKDYAEDLPGISYPYPKLCIFNGSGGMEFPMIVNDGEVDSVSTLFLTTHEIGHTYFPFMVGTNQKRHGWLDEGLVTMIGQEQHLKRDATYNIKNTYLQYYPRVAGKEPDVPPLVNSQYISNDIFQIHEYVRPSLAFWTLREILGPELFRQCLREFIQTWEGKHPTPWDFFNLFEKTSGMDLGWFFAPWFAEFAYPDLVLGDIVNYNDSTIIKIINEGGMPFPSKLKLIFTDGSEDIFDLPATLWKVTKEHSFRYRENKTILSATLITEGFPDVNIENNHREQ